MPELKALAGVGAMIFALGGFIPYLIGIRRGTVKTSKASWIIWLVVGSILLTSYYKVGAWDTLGVSAAFTAGPLLAVVFLFRYGDNQWSRLDKTCLALAIASLPCWYATNNPLVALMINIVVDILGAIPLVVNCLKNPGSEKKATWILWWCGNALNLLAIEHWTLASWPLWLYPLYMAIANTIITNVVVWWRKPIFKTP